MLSEYFYNINVLLNFKESINFEIVVLLKIICQNNITLFWVESLQTNPLTTSCHRTHASKTQKQHIFSAFYSILKDFLVMWCFILPPSFALALFKRWFKYIHNTWFGLAFAVFFVGIVFVFSAAHETCFPST